MKCPLNRYCEAGATVPSVCDQNRIVSVVGATDDSFCQECSGGRYYNCLPEYVCPKGHVCPANPYKSYLDTSDDWNWPTECPKYHYRDVEGGVTMDLV